MTRRTHVAIDIGASSGRHVLGWLEDGKLCLREMYRFENGADMRDGMLVWDHARLEREIVAGLKACRDAGETPETVAIDTWGVDYALLDESGALLGDKSNTVIFDNAKLHALVPSFRAQYRFDQAAPRSVRYFLTHPEAQRDDADFDRFCDRIVEVMERAEREIAAL